MKVSVAVTVYNEEASISALINSLLKQTKKPSEIIIVDGGSEDKTVEIIKHYQKRDRRIKLIKEPGTISHGRNTSIEVAKNEVIVLTDAGCLAKNDWLEKISEPFRYKEVNVVAGFYEMIGNQPLQKAVAVFLGIPSQRFDPTSFIPSARSMAFRKKVWEEVGGFREKLERAGEDTLFVYEVIKKGFKIVRVKDAIVYWEVPKTLSESLQKFFYYAKGDAQSGIWWNPLKGLASHNIKVFSIFARYVLGFVFLFLAISGFFSILYLYVLVTLYLSYSIWKWRDVVFGWKERLWLPIIQISSDFAVMIGFIAGLIDKK